MMGSRILTISNTSCHYYLLPIFVLMTISVTRFLCFKFLINKKCIIRLKYSWTGIHLIKAIKLFY